jgi:hypothetical protein
MVFIISLMHLPHLFYAVIHIFIFVICALSLSPENWRRRPLWTAAVIIVGLVYNPVIPIHLNRALWILINIPTAFLFFQVLNDESETLSPVTPDAFILPESVSQTKPTIDEPRTTDKPPLSREQTGN